MHKLQVKWQDGHTTEHNFETMEQFEEFVTIAKILNAKMRFFSETFERWTRWG